MAMKGQPLEIIRGTTNTFEIYLTDATGTAYTMRPEEQLIFGVKQSYCDTEYKLTKVITPSDYESGKYAFTIMPSDSENLLATDYFYDIGLQSDDNYYMVVECNRFSIHPNITHRMVT